MSNQNSASIHNRAEVLRLESDIQYEMIRLIRKQLEDEDINFSGDLSISFHATDGYNGFKTVETSNIYANLVENGTPAGSKINFDALRNWVERKLGVDHRESEEVTWKIYRKIINKGIPAKKFMKKAIKKFIGLHGKINVKNVGKSGGGKSKTMKKVMKIAKRILKHIKSFTKAVKSVQRTFKKMAKPINKGRRK